MEKKNIRIMDHFKSQKTTVIVIILIILGIILLILPSNKSSSDNTVNGSEERLKEYAQTLESKIATLCSKVKGVDKVSVTVYFDTGFETVYAYNEESKETSSGYNSEKKYVTIGSGNDESMVCVVERMPNICGVAVVCQGGGNPTIVSELINLISSAFGVPKNKIYIAEGKK